MRWQQPHDETVRAVVDNLHAFCAKEVPPVYARCEEAGIFPQELMEPLAKMGVFGLTIQEEYEGLGMNTVVSSYVAREFSYWWPALHLIWTANSSLAAFPIMYAGTKAQQARILPKLATGEILGCYALTEPNAGSDARSMRMRAEWDGEHWVLNGSKTFITNAQHASVAIVFAGVPSTLRNHIAAFILESECPGLKYPGVSVSHIRKHALKSSDFCEIHFDNVKLPKGALLGGDRQGFEIAMKTLDGGRINIAAQAIGMAMWFVDEVEKYVKLRQQFGKRIWENQHPQFQLADAKSQLDTAWSRIVDVSEMRDRGEDITEAASGVKLAATEIASRLAFELYEYFGGMFFTQETHWLPRFLDLLAPPVYEGANNIQRMIIAKHLEQK